MPVYRLGSVTPRIAATAYVAPGAHVIGRVTLDEHSSVWFGAVLRATGVGTALTDSMSDLGLPLIVTAYLVSCALRIAQGSATVAITATAGIIGETVAAGNYSQAQIALIVIAISAGSIILSHVNDGGFWLIKEYMGTTVGQTLKTWTVMECIISVCGLIGVLLLSLVI